MSNNPSKSLTLYLTGILFFLVIPGFCAENKLTELQKQARIYRDKGVELQKEGGIDEALPYYQKALLLDPGYVVAYNDAGIIFEALGEPEEAKQMYLRAIEIAPNYPNSYSNLALFYEAQGDYANAILCWAKRATLGGPEDRWGEVARKRVEDIARIYPEAYNKIGQGYKESLKQQSIFKASLKEFGILQPQESPKVSLFIEDAATDTKKLDHKARALNYLARAKENFTRGEYVAALKEATVAEYLDSTNGEISAFVEKVRRALLR